MADPMPTLAQLAAGNLSGAPTAINQIEQKLKVSPAESQGSGCGDARRVKATKIKKVVGMPRASQEPAARGKARCMLQVR